jgi:hypothetical protein
MDHARRLAVAEARQGVSAAENHLLRWAGLRQTALPADFIRYAHGYEGLGGPRAHSVDALWDALEGLRARLCLTVLTDDDVRAEAARLAASTLPERDDGGDFKAGYVDFTPGGYRAHRAILFEVFGPEHVDYGDSFWRFDRDTGRFTVVAPTAELCLRRIREVRALGRVPGSYDPKIRILEASPPAPIGPWKPWRFALRDSGFVSVVTSGPT